MPFLVSFSTKSKFLLYKNGTYQLLIKHDEYEGRKLIIGNPECVIEKNLYFNPEKEVRYLETDFSDIIACVQYSYVPYIQRHNFMATIAESRKMTRKLEKLAISDMNRLEWTIFKFRKRKLKSQTEK